MGLVLLQKKCVRTISKVGYYEHTAPLISDLKLLTVKQIYNLNCAKFTFCSLNKLKFTEFTNRLVTNNSSHNYETRSGKKLKKPRKRLLQLKNYFLNNGIEMWNLLPDYLKNVKHSNRLKRKLKSIYWENEHY